MELAVVVGHGGLLAVAYSGCDGHGPYQPRVLGKERRGGVFPQAYAEVYGEEPEVAGEAVEYAADAGVLACHAGKLPVGAVEGVGPHEQQHSCHVNPYIVEIESYSGSYSEKYRCNGDGVRLYAEALCQTCPAVAYGTVEGEVDILLGVERFKRSFV